MVSIVRFGGFETKRIPCSNYADGEVGVGSIPIFVKA
jgi:hypothetical protein